MSFIQGLKRSMPYTLPCVKQILIASVKQLYSSRCSAQGSVMTKRAGVGNQDGREAQEGGDICISMTDSHCCTAETNTIL